LAQAFAFRAFGASGVNCNPQFIEDEYNWNMGKISDELFEIAEQLDGIAARFESGNMKESLQRLEDAANQVGKAWSGSWLGYHSRVYYRDFHSPAPGARFSQEWGFMDLGFGDTRGDWAEYEYDYVRKEIYDIAGNPDLESTRKLAQTARGDIEDKRVEILSSISTALDEREDLFLSKLKDKLEKATIPTVSDFVKYYCPSGKLISRDMPAINQGFQTPPHIGVLAEVMAIRTPGKACEELSKAAKQAGAHLGRRERYSRAQRAIGERVFIGHGRSSIWKDLKEFIQDRLGLVWDEFNRVPIAGITNITRLSQMLDDAGIGFLILTAED
jgi:hypothetical protein